MFGWTFVVLAVAGAACFAQTAPFRIQIPDLSDGPGDGDVVEIPGNLPDALLIHVLNPVAADIDYGRIMTKLNGQSASYIQTVTGSANGKIVRMDLKLRQGMRLVPGTNTVEVTAVNRRGRKFYRNFLIRTKEDPRNGYFTYESGTVPGPGGGDHPPNIIVTQPDAPVTLASGETRRMVRVAGTVSAAHPLSKLEVQGKSWSSAQASTTFDRQVEVSAADSGISIEAVDERGNRSTVRIPVARTGATRGAGVRGERYALIVGISEYAGKNGPPALPSAASDARNFSQSLQSQLGFSKENILLLTDAAATSDQLRAALRSFAGRPRPEDLLLVYFAGYGLHDPLDPEHIYLAAHDTQLGRFGETAIPLDELKNSLKTYIKSKNTVLIFDADRAVEGQWATPNNNLVNAYLVGLFAGDPTKAVLVSSNVNEVSRDAGGSGLFTQELLNAARGRADVNGDGVVTIREWFLAAQNRVKDASKGAQNPGFELAGPEMGIFALAR